MRLFFRNPESYDAKMSFWTEAIEKWMDSKKTFKFRICDFAEDFQANSRKPLCLDEVLLNMKDTSKVLVDSKDYFKSLQETWSDIPWKLVKASTSYLYSAMSPKSKEQRKQDLDQMEFIHLQKLEKRGKILVHEIKDVGNVYCKKSDILDTDPNVECLLEYLKITNVVDLRDIDNEIYIKHGDKFNDTDVAIIKLEVMIEHLETVVVDMDHKLREKKVALKAIIANGQSRNKAKSVLRQVKHLTKDIEAKSATLDKLKFVLESIQNAQEDKKIIETLQIAKKALQQEVNGVSVDKVHDLIDDIKDLVNETADINQALSQAAINESIVNDEELENELKQMLEEENEKELQEALDRLGIEDHEPEGHPAKSPKKLSSSSAVAL